MTSRANTSVSLARRTSFWLRHARPILLPFMLGIAAIGGWSAAVTKFSISPATIPSPGRVLQSLWENFGLLEQHIWASGIDMVLALLSAAALGFVLALLTDLFSTIRAAVYPNLLILELLPKIALAPLFILWLGTGSALRLTFATFLAFFPVLLATTTGLMATDTGHTRLCRSLQASAFQTFLYVRLPSALPYIFGGFKIAATMATIGVIVGEFLAGDRGLGYIIMYAAANMETALMFAAIFLLSVLGVALFCLVAVIEALISRRYGKPRA